ncbi:MAG: hypothetical protein RL186_204 [Pseudomonadota bacterium]
MTDTFPPKQDPHLQANADEMGEGAAIEAAPLVAYPDRPWVVFAGIAGAFALGGLVLVTLLSGQKSRQIGGVVPTRDPQSTAGLGAPIPEPPDLFTPIPAPPMPPVATMIPEANSDAAEQANVSNPPMWQPPQSPPPPPSPQEEARNSSDTGSNTSQTAAREVRQGADLGQRLRSPALIVDLSNTNPAAASGEAAAQAAAAAASAAGGDNDAFAARVSGADTASARAGPLRNPKFVVPQGAMISAVLETAINSDLPGFVRAIVSRDVSSFDGSRVLIPRGSRLVGQYKSEVALGQSRAFVVWTRLMRPDGVSVALGSPGTDTLGRAGLGGRVERHYWQRFGPSILTTAISAALSGSNRSNQLVIGTAQTTAGALSTGDSIKPTVIVAQGTAIQVFVARDLDFSQIGKPPSDPVP